MLSENTWLNKCERLSFVRGRSRRCPDGTTCHNVMQFTELERRNGATYRRMFSEFYGVFIDISARRLRYDVDNHLE